MTSARSARCASPSSPAGTSALKLVRYADGAGPRCGLLDGGEIIDLPYPSWPAAFAVWDVTRADLDRAIAIRLDVRPAGSVRLLPPLRPGALLCATANYFDELLERGDAPPGRARGPAFLTKVTSAVIGPDEAVRIPRHSKQVDWQAELGVVIGRPCFRASLENALSHVAGYTIVNDVTAWDLAAQPFDSSAPLGPSITLASDVPDPHALIIRTWVNDTLRQDSTTAQMIFSIPEQIVHLSELLTLQPGDVIATGTPAGTGRAHGTFLRAGDVVTIEIEHLGVLRNPVV